MVDMDFKSKITRNAMHVMCLFKFLTNSIDGGTTQQQLFGKETH